MHCRLKVSSAEPTKLKSDLHAYGMRVYWLTYRNVNLQRSEAVSKCVDQ